MPAILNLISSHKPIKEYYSALGGVQQLNLLRSCGSKMGWTLAEQHQIKRPGRRPLRADGVFLDQFKLRRGVWEAKDTKDDLAKEIKKKFKDGGSPTSTSTNDDSMTLDAILDAIEKAIARWCLEHDLEFVDSQGNTIPVP